MAVLQGELEEYTNKCENYTMNASQIAHLAIVTTQFIGVCEMVGGWRRAFRLVQGT